jgi:hypothetical protein
MINHESAKNEMDKIDQLMRELMGINRKQVLVSGKAHRRLTEGGQLSK